MQRPIIGVTGHAGSGKSTVGKYLSERYGFTCFEGSSDIKKRATSHGVELSDRMSYENYYRDTQAKLGFNWLSQIVLGHSGPVAQIGLRTRADTFNLRSHGGITIATVCPLEVCYERADKKNPKNARSFEQYIEDEAALDSDSEFGSQVNWTIEQADYHVDSDQPLSDFQAAVGEIVDRYLQSVSRGIR